MKNNVLLVDTNFSSAPIYEYLTAKGYNVFACGGNRNDFIARTISNYIELDYSNTEILIKLTQQLQIDYIVPGCNDLSYQVCSCLNKDSSYGTDNYNITQLINNKEKFRKFATQLGLPTPTLILDGEIGDYWPVIVKPVDAYSGRGVSVIYENKKELLSSALQQAKKFSRTNSCIIEEYIEGQLYSHSAFIVDGKIEIDFIVEEHGSANQFVVDTSRVLYDFPKEVLFRIRNAIHLIAGTLELVDGLIHTQFIKNGNEFWLIEVTRRCPGDLYSKLIELSTSFPYVEAYVSPFLNQSFNFHHYSKKQRYVMRHTVSVSKECLFISIKFNTSVDIEKMIYLSKSGEYIKSSPFGRIALLFINAASEHEICNLMKLAVERNLYTINSTI